LKLTIGQSILVGYGSVMLCSAIAGIAAHRSTQHLLESSEWVRHTFLVIGEARNTRVHLLEIESAIRAYIPTGDEHFLEPVEASRTHLAESRKLLRKLTADNASQQSRLDILDPAIERRLGDLTRISSLRAEKGYAAALAAGVQTNSRERMAEIRTLLTAAEDEERGLLTERERITRMDAQSTDQIFLYGNLIGFGLAAMIGIATRLSITGPLGQFRQFLTSVRAATENLDSATMEILASARQQSAVTGEQVAAYQETSATMQQVSKSCSQIAEKAKQVTITAEAVSVANISGLDAVQKTNQSVEAIHEQAEAVAQNIVSLSEKTQMVGDILATVNDIAEQSHLLALNAAIEAAAAGEHGRSFSVVAGEIKNLADQSKAATVQVKTILGDIQKEINTSVMLTEEAVKRVDLGKHQADLAASAIRNMAANIDQSVQAFQQIVAGTNQQQIGFENVTQAMKDLSRGSEQAATSNRQTEKAAVSLADISAQLRTATEGCRL
jgi:methyl-accepting chemotaxis protein